MKGVIRKSFALLMVAMLITCVVSPAVAQDLDPVITIDSVTTSTDVATQTLIGTIEAGATVTLSADTATTFTAVTYPTNTTWTSNVSLIEGSNNITATATATDGATLSGVSNITGTVFDADGLFTATEFCVITVKATSVANPNLTTNTIVDVVREFTLIEHLPFEIDAPGHYKLNVSITDATFSIAISINASDVILDGAGHTIDGIDTSGTIGVSATNVVNVTIKNLIVTDWGRHGIRFENVNDGMINNVVTNSNRDGIFTTASSNNVFSNIVSNMNIRGVAIWGASNNNSLLNITASANERNGIVLRICTSNNVLRNNVMYENAQNFAAWSVQDIDTSNTVNGKPIYHLVGESDIVIDSSSNAGAVYLINSINITVRDLSLSHNTDGIFMYNTTDSLIENVSTSSNMWGVHLWSSCNNVVRDVTTSLNFFGLRLHDGSNDNIISHVSVSSNRNGISIQGSNNNILSNNNIVDSGFRGLNVFGGSVNNRIYLNNFINNTRDNIAGMNLVHSIFNSATTINYIFNGTLFTSYLGNYYDDYTGIDADGDGIGDTRHQDLDSYPLMATTNHYTLLLSLGDAVDNTELVFTTGGDACWFGQMNTYIYDGDAAESGNISHNQNSWMNTTVEGPGFLSFYWNVSSEGLWRGNPTDYLAFEINGVVQDIIYGRDVTWTQMNYALGSGTHTLSWVYSKDVSMSSGLDSGWVDKVEFTPTEKIIVIEPAHVTLEIGDTQEFNAAVYPDTMDQNVTWSVNDLTVGSIDVTTGVFTAIAPGIVTVIATSVTHPNLTGTVIVTVAEPDIPPVVEITFPADGATLSGVLNITGTAYDVNLRDYRLYVIPADVWMWAVGCFGRWMRGIGLIELSTNPVSDGVLGTFDTTSLPDGNFSLRLRARDTGDNSVAISPISIRIDNDVIDDVLPVAEITLPEEGEIVSGETSITGTVNDDNLWRYRVRAHSTDGWWAACAGCGDEPVIDGQLALWRTARIPDGNYTLRVFAADLGGNVNIALRNVTVDNVVDDVMPVAEITSPIDGTTISDTVNVIGTASDDNIWMYVIWTFDADGRRRHAGFARGTSVIEGRLSIWDTTRFPDGEYLVELHVTDWGGNTNIVSINVTVDNIADPDPPVGYFDTGPGTYPSIAGTHTGTIKLTRTITVQNLYTYSLPGTGGHTRSVHIWNDRAVPIATGEWDGFVGDWRNISFNEPVVLSAGRTYSFEIITGSYPQIHHTDALSTANGWINCTGFVDVNGRAHQGWIPAIRLDSITSAVDATTIFTARVLNANGGSSAVDQNVIGSVDNIITIGAIDAECDFTALAIGTANAAATSVTDPAVASMSFIVVCNGCVGCGGCDPPADDQPADDQPADDQPADDQPADDQPADDQPVDDQPVDDQPADDQPADDQPADDQPADDQPADDQPADDQPADDQPADDQPADDQPADDQPADDQPADDQPADDQPADDQPADDQPADDAPADDQPADDAPADDAPADDAPADDTPADDTPADDTPTDDTPADDTPVDDMPVVPGFGLAAATLTFLGVAALLLKKNKD